MWLSRGIFALFILLLVGFAYLMFDPLHVHPQRRDALRAQHLDQIGQLVSARVAVTHLQPLGDIGVEWQQLGQATDNCQLMTDRCQIENSACFDANFLTNDLLQTLPSDPTGGYITRSGYAVRLLDNETVELKSCYAETKDVELHLKYTGQIYDPKKLVR